MRFSINIRSRRVQVSPSFRSEGRYQTHVDVGKKLLEYL